MLKGVNDILKTMGEALIFADAGEMLTEDQKAAILARSKRLFTTASDALPPRVVLAGDEELLPESVDRAIAMCLEKKAMLDLLYVSPEGSKADARLSTVLPRLVAETDLDFQLTRRHGDLLAVTHAYTCVRRDTLMILINVSDRLRDRAERYRRNGRWLRSTQLPAVELIDDAVHA